MSAASSSAGLAGGSFRRIAYENDFRCLCYQPLVKTLFQRHFQDGATDKLALGVERPAKMDDSKTMPVKAKVLDVAREAGVSPSTVSRTFNRPEIVVPEIKKRVLAAAAKLGYSANPAAKALRTQKTHIVGAVIPSLDYAIFASMVDNFQAKFALAGYMTVVVTTGFDNRSIFDQVRLLVERGAEALLLVGAIEDENLRTFLKETNIPAVSTYSFHDDPLISSVGFDNRAATAGVVSYLIGLGHREFAMIAASPEGNDRQRSRIQAYQEVIRRGGLSGADNIVIRPYTIRDGADAMRTIHGRSPQVTAVVCNADVFAFGALIECRTLGLSVPKDIAITGFDDAEYAALLDPPLTTISVPATEMGAKAAELLYRRLSEGTAIRPVKLETRLMIRNTTVMR
jgi:LacI family transcriptional regulator